MVREFVKFLRGTGKENDASCVYPKLQSGGQFPGGNYGEVVCLTISPKGTNLAGGFKDKDEQNHHLV